MKEINNNIEYWEMSKALTEYFMPYAVKTISDRALPDVRDGFKPIHRRVLYKMGEIKLFIDKERAKSHPVVGKVLEIHGHGDSSVYEAMCKLTKENDSLLHPYIDGEGAFGKQYSKDNPSASRYTFVRLNRFTQETILKDIYNNTVKFIGEKEHKQPLALPVRYPNILIKNNEGIAVGMKCFIPSFNLVEICETAKAFIDNENIELLDYIKSPDFSSGGEIIYNKKSLKDILEIGYGKMTVRSVYRFNKEDNCIEVMEIPYNTTADNIVAEITELLKTQTNTYGITDVRDETGFNKELKREELMITIDVKKNTDIEKTMAFLFKKTSLQKSFTANMRVLVNYKPKVLGIKDILRHWLEFRRDCITNSLKADLTKLEEELHVMKGIEKTLLDIDKTIEIIRHSKRNEVHDKLIEFFKIDIIQAKEITKLRLWDINEEFILERIKNIDAFQGEVDTLRNKIEDVKQINQIIKDDLNEIIERYGKPRKTKIIYEHDMKNITNEDLISDYSCQIVLTNEYIKKNLRYSESQKLKDGDQVLEIQQVNNKDTLILLTNQGRAINKKVNDFETCQPSDMGSFQKSFLGLNEGEQVIKVISSDKEKDILIISAEGKALILNTKDFLSSNRTKQYIKLISEKFDNNEVIGIIEVTDELSNIFIQTQKKDKIEINLLNNTNGLDYFKGRLNNGGNFIYNCRSKKDRLVKLL